MTAGLTLDLLSHLSLGGCRQLLNGRNSSVSGNKAKQEFGFNTFHMAELMANNQNSEFADKDYWDNKRKALLLKRLREIIGKHAGQGFEYSVLKRITTT